MPYTTNRTSVRAMEWARGWVRDQAQFFQPRQERECPCCSYVGYFVSAKKRGPREFRCPGCSSRPRDRQIGLIFNRLGLSLLTKNILHLAPEWPIFREGRKNPKYVGGDIQKRRNANAIVDITNIQFANGHFDLIICNHVLEHVANDRKAMEELHRVLSDDGIGIITVPIDIDTEVTWEPPPEMPLDEVYKLVGWDHKRQYGLDFSKKLEEVGFNSKTIWFNDDERGRHHFFHEPVYVIGKSLKNPLLAAL